MIGIVTAPLDIVTVDLLSTDKFRKNINEARTIYANTPKVHLTSEKLLASNTQKNYYYSL